MATNLHEELYNLFSVPAAKQPHAPSCQDYNMSRPSTLIGLNL